jgi:methionyl-tRNA synthetase
MTDKSYYITTPIYYVNDKPHIGHTYTTVACDVLARFKRLDGYDVKFLTGTDEHGLKVHQAAEKNGVDPQSFTDKVSQNFRDLTEIMNFSNDDFIRTTEERHKKAAQALWSKLVEAGDIYLDKYSGWYAVRDEAYYGEDELTDVDGKKIAPSGAECEWVEEESYFFKLSAWQDKLLAYYESHPDFIMPDSRRNEVVSFVKGGLRDLSVSRTTFNWGVPVPGDDKHVMYVWIDALTNYITAIDYPDESSDTFKKFWPADVHMVGKDILRFHAVYWPAFLMAAGLEPPKRIFAHGWWTIEGQKMSKSLGNVIAPDDLVARYGRDASRYFMMREVPFGNDGNFSHENAIARINSDLANGLGNLSQRTLSMIYKNCDEAIPQPQDFTDEDKKLLNLVQTEMLPKVRDELDLQRFHKAIEVIMGATNEANAYVDHQAPWTLKKENPERMRTVLYVLAETVRCLALVMQPFTPESAAKMLDQLQIPQDQRGFDALSSDYALKGGVKIEKPEGVFPRIQAEEEKQAAAG